MVSSANDLQQQDIYVKEIANKGKGVFARRSFRAGEIVVKGIPAQSFSQRVVPFSYQITLDKHVILDGVASLINHCCTANTGARRNQYDGYDFVALHDILPDEEITVDYETTEWEVVGFHDCCCGSSRCRKTIQGFRYHSEQLKQQYSAEFIANYLDDLLQKN